MRKELSDSRGSGVNSHALGRVGEFVGAERVGDGDGVIGRVERGRDRGCDGAPGERDVRFADVGDVVVKVG
jgi:hypothetical protein